MDERERNGWKKLMATYGPAQQDRMREMLHLSDNSRDDYVVIQASCDSISRSCELRDPVAGGGSDCHADHFTGNPRHQCKCHHAEANWKLTHPGEPLPTEPNVHMHPWDIPVENFIHGGKGATSPNVPIVYCRDCQHHETTNPEAKLWEMVHVCHCPDLQVDGQNPLCIEARRDGNRLNPDCLGFKEITE